ncbi:hypothetical protein R0381_002952 [Jeongeupia wiesaeckerbachi]|uniref:hypothetical protein n=1 Tax=Jeongeupia wiesaeckerbachi TaxID=3051218 RepID=UPI003D80489F
MKARNFVVKVCGVAVSCLFMAQASFANFGCSGKVSMLAVDSAAAVFVAINGGPIHSICNLDARAGYSFVPSGCKAAYATLLAAKTADKTVSISYGGDAYTCSSIPAWAVMTSAYFVDGPY